MGIPGYLNLPTHTSSNNWGLGGQISEEREARLNGGDTGRGLPNHFR